MTMSSTSPTLPCKVLDVVGRHLIMDDAFGTCANLNVTSHAVKDATIQTLWTHMYWTSYHDPTTYNKDEIKAAWKIFKASPGARYIKHVLRLASARLGHFVPCIPRRRRNHHHRAFPPSLVRATTGGLLDLPRWRDADELETDTQSEASDDSLVGEERTLPTPPVGVWLREIAVRIMPDVTLEVDDHIVLSTHLVMLLRRYAVARVAEDDILDLEPPCFRIGDLDMSVMLLLAVAYVHLCPSDLLYTTFDLLLCFAYDEDTGSPNPEQDEISGLTALFVFTRVNSTQAAQSNPYDYLGHFHVSNDSESICACISVDVSRQESLPSFAMGWPF
ncbi:hypothetical protein QFC21_006796 [Naganishia friedmannii]|uniref:Uncharacterized protein n=1 Tax=Naganishia friedmannii TaxID=89922 RepID=A0ACC2V0V0_9TREE|nr:hypothetical protein QFC21_006796 [Naganishia friedmannii]